MLQVSVTICVSYIDLLNSSTLLFSSSMPFLSLQVCFMFDHFAFIHKYVFFSSSFCLLTSCQHFLNNKYKLPTKPNLSLVKYYTARWKALDIFLKGSLFGCRFQWPCWTLAGRDGVSERQWNREGGGYRERGNWGQKRRQRSRNKKGVGAIGKWK